MFRDQEKLYKALAKKNPKYKKYLEYNKEQIEALNEKPWIKKYLLKQIRDVDQLIRAERILALLNKIPLKKTYGTIYRYLGSTTYYKGYEVLNNSLLYADHTGKVEYNLNIDEIGLNKLQLIKDKATYLEFEDLNSKDLIKIHGLEPDDNNRASSGYGFKITRL